MVFLIVELLFIYTNPLGVNESQISNSLNVYPNPSTTIINIAGSTANTYSIFDITGKMVQSGNLLSAKTIDVSNLVSGNYILKTNANETQKIIIK
jgi:hypothetical protein